MQTPVSNPTNRPANRVSDIGLVVLLKAPGSAKRRLAHAIGELASDAARHMWACALEDALDWRGPVWFAPAETEDGEWLRTQLGADAPIVPQRGGNLGARINRVDRELRRRGTEKLLFVGTDCPGMDTGYLEQAAARLDRADAVFGPSRDGGVVLMGARRSWPDLRGLGWSTDAFGAELVELCSRRGWSLETLGLRADIDTLNDLLDAAGTLSSDKRPARRALANWLDSNRGALSALGGSG